ncbi:pentatricopeptide repeat-containing protein At2g17210 [Cucurbita pepo subsp. pepo]|uniref:pentatricopeptide repeat-containing protein At2g17210 n=1 Tax=Cucurbita pepo subsp. pepo TaxID=3664 RepID=UPI000C9D4C43|nr:pentatricopeptide repeat-containing protein At2g17210 [Cucurbita pepo subsp. pepo]
MFAPLLMPAPCSFTRMRFSNIHSGLRLSNSISTIKEASSSGKWREALQLYREIRLSGSQLPDSSVLPSILKACSNVSFKLGTAMHGCLIKQGCQSSTSVANSAIDLYMKWGDLDSAHRAFVSLKNKDSVSWNVMVHGNFSNGGVMAGLWWFKMARFADFQPNVSSLVIVIQAFRERKSYCEGFAAHGYIIRSGFSAIVSVQNSLLSLYTEVDMFLAHKLFDEMYVRNDIVSWSVMTGGFVQIGEDEHGLLMFRDMVTEAGISPDGVTIVSVLKACTNLRDISLGTMVHGLVVCRGLEDDLFVGNSLIDMYSKCSKVHSSFKAFKAMPEKNIVSWNSMLSAYALNEKPLEAVALLRTMVEEGVEKDEVTFVNVLQIFKHFLDSLQCRSVHGAIIRRGYESNELVMNSVIDAYAKCNLIELAGILFDGMKKKDVVTWSTMIAGFAYNGDPDKAISIFKRMNEEVKPNKVSIMNLMEACAVSAESRRSKWAHGIAVRRGLASEVAVGTAIIDMYSKCGDIAASIRAFNQIPEKNVVCWSAMISAFGINGLAHEALLLFEKMKQYDMKPNAVTALSLLSACSHGGLVEEGLSSFKSMAKKHEITPGLEHYSCVVDMLARAGKFKDALELIEKMPEEMEAGASIWGTLLSSCRSYGNIVLGSGAASRVLELEPLNSTGYMLASNLYANCGLMSDSAKMRRLAKERGVKVVAGYSLVHINSQSWRFVAGDEFNPRADEIYLMVEQLHSVMKIDYLKVLDAIQMDMYLI